GYENPQEATGSIVCVNFHLANKPVDIEVPQAVLLDTVFEAVMKEKKSNLSFQNYRPTKKNTLVIDPVPGEGARFIPTGKKVTIMLRQQ
ncbi:hypothetical protein Godav_002796, partial [Gossypium davidsonii]|nr:hypothetical protein [Gossypium davidsonii]